MTEDLGDVFADTVFWLALVVRQDAHHARAHAWAQRIRGRITTTSAVLFETANALARPAWRTNGVRLINHIREREDVEIVNVDADLFDRGWKLYCDRTDKSWSLVDCVSFLVMQERSLTTALTTDHHFEQVGFRAVLLEDAS